MAEAIASRFSLAGVTFVSAGTVATPGQPATAEAQEVMAELSVDLSPHRARRIESLVALEPDLVFAMEPHHISSALARVPSWQGRVSLLDPSGVPIVDPYGRSLSTYRTIRDTIAAAVESAADGWVP